MNDLVISNGALTRGQADQYTGSLAESSRRIYMLELRSFFEVDELTDITIDQIKSVNLATAEQYREKLKAEGYKPATINRKLTCLSKFYDFLSRREIGVMDYNPFSGREGLARVKYNKRYSNTRCLTKEEMKKMYKVTTEGSDLESVRNRIIVLLLCTTGMRRSEIVSIKLGDIGKTQDKDIIEIVGKGDKERVIVISGTIKFLIDNYLAMREVSPFDKDRYLLVSHSTRSAKNEETPITDKAVYNVIKSLADKAGIDPTSISPHCMRHTYITNSLDMGVNLEDIQDMVGHADINTTRRYDHINRVIKNNPAEAHTAIFNED